MEEFYKQLLKKYISHVIDCESISFIDESGFDPLENFTEAELKILKDFEADIRTK